MVANVAGFCAMFLLIVCAACPAMLRAAVAGAMNKAAFVRPRPINIADRALRPAVLTASTPKTLAPLIKFFCWLKVLSASSSGIPMLIRYALFILRAY